MFIEEDEIMLDFAQWEGFTGTAWKSAIDVREFIKDNYTPYEGDSSFLSSPLRSRSRASKAFSLSINSEVRAVGPLKKELSPS